MTWTLSLRDVILICSTIASAIAIPAIGIWVRMESRMARVETGLEDVKRIVLNGSHKKAATPSRRKNR